MTSVGMRGAEMDGWRYYWSAEPGINYAEERKFGVPAGTAFLTRRRVPTGKTTQPNFEIETFIILDEDRCLNLAWEINEGIHPDSPGHDPKTGRKIGYL